MNVLLSIRPKYIEQIIKGNKRYEFRKSIFRKDVDKVWIYGTSPTKKIIGTFVIGEILKDTPDNLWNKFNGLSGMCEQDFFEYYSGIKEGVALELKYLKLFKVPIDPKVIFPDFTPPQSFYYLDDTLIKAMEKIEDGEHNYF
jgi:predicted transcriptional regulator